VHKWCIYTHASASRAAVRIFLTERSHTGVNKHFRAFLATETLFSYFSILITSHYIKFRVKNDKALQSLYRQFNACACALFFVCDRSEDHQLCGVVMVHQSQWQQRMLELYGTDTCLLDATYNTCKPTVLLRCCDKQSCR